MQPRTVFDSQNVSFYSVAEKKYVCYFRSWTGKGYSGFRTVSRTTSDNFIDWSKPERMQFGDTPLEHLYTNQTSSYLRAPHLSVGIAARFMPGRRVISAADAKKIGVNPSYFGDISDAVLLTSRGGNRYDRTFMESYIRPGIGLENWVSRTNYPALGLLQTSDSELSLYVQKNYGQPTSQLRRYSLRLDGFSSVHADYRGGTMTTRPLSFLEAGQTSANPSNGIRLRLNAATSAAGSIRVELLDHSGKVIPGYSMQDCDVVIGDYLERIVSWKGKSDLTGLAPRVIHVRFQMKDADLFSLVFREDGPN